MTREPREKPAPSPTATSAPYWDAARAGRLLLRSCRACAAITHPPRPLCPVCWSNDVGWVESSGRGEIVSATVVHRPASAAFAADAPYVLAIVLLEEGAQLMTNVIGDGVAAPGAVRIGAAVCVRFEPRGDHRVPVFVLA